MPSQSYTRFQIDFLEANSWTQRKDGAPLELLDALDETERTMAEEALIRLLSLGDDWPARGLCHLRSRKALPSLQKLLPKTVGTVRAVTALAIWQISREPVICDELVRLSHEEYTDDGESTQTFTMIDVVHCLAHLPYQSAVTRLEELKGSRNYLIAYNAKYALGLRRTAYSSDADSSSAE